MVTTRDEASYDLLQDLGVDLNAAGKIVDYLDPAISRADRPEERVRQYYARVLHEEYGYPKENMAFEAPINIGRDVKFADIAVYLDREAAHARIQGRIHLVVETKAPTQQDGHGQLTSYIFSSSASGGVWFNGDVAYYRRLDAPRPELSVWTNIPRRGETWDTVGHYRKTDLRAPVDLKHVFQRSHNAMYRTGLDSEDVALDMVRIILAKYRDEQNDNEVCEFRCTPEEFRSGAGKSDVARRVHALFSQVVEDHPDVFPQSERITIGEDSLALVVNELQPFRFLADDETEQVYDVIGTAFEVYVAAHLKGARGQYFTNRLVVDMMVAMLDPDERDIIYDPACGSGGFLIAALRHVRAKVLSSARSAAAKTREIRNASQRLYGTDIAPKLVRVAKTNMILNGDGHGGILHVNALGDVDSKLPADSPLRTNAAPRQRPTCILTNPPFGASHDLRERSRDTLARFDLGHVWADGSDGWLEQTDAVNATEGVPPEILFLEKCIDQLGAGGKVGIVLARGVLDNKDAVAAREFVLKNCIVLGVVNCHPNTFAPFNGTKASILFLEKKRHPGFQRDEDYPVFMAISQRVGQDSMGREIHRLDGNGEVLYRNGAPVVDHDLNEIVRSWKAHRAGEPIPYEGAWAVPLSKILGEPEKRMNPVRFAPAAERALGHVLELAGSVDWLVERLGDFASVYNGPRFRRPFADDGVTSGAQIIRMYTPKAFFEERGESAKYLDANKANKTQLRQLEVLTLGRDWILIVDSGTAGKLLGKVGMTTSVHEGSIGNNNMIRVVIEDPIRRDYVYRFLSSPLGQTLLLRNVYGTNQDHIEPDDVRDVPIPIPRDSNVLATLHKQVREISSLREQAAALEAAASATMTSMFTDALAGEGADLANLIHVPAHEDASAE